MHALKGPCATLKLSFMTQLSVTLVEDAKAGRWTEAADKFRSLRTNFQHLKSQVGSFK
jgi:hypothetical protein